MEIQSNISVKNFCNRRNTINFAIRKSVLLFMRCCFFRINVQIKNNYLYHG